MINAIVNAALAINVLVVDTGLFPTKEMLPYVQEYEVDMHGHGTMVTSIILFGDLKNKSAVCKEVRVTVCEYLNAQLTSSTSCLDKMLQNKYDIINISGGGDTKFIKETAALKQAKGNPIIVAAAGNKKRDILLKPFYPASLAYEGYANVFPIGNGTSLANKSSNSNWASHSMIWINGDRIAAYDTEGEISLVSGSSMSAALYTHKLLKEKCNGLHTSNNN